MPTHARSRRSISVALALLPLAGCLFGRPSTAELLPADPPAFVPAASLEHTFYWLSVPENRDAPDAGTIKIPVYRFASRAETPEPDPVLIMLGGPGLPTSTIAPYLDYYRYLNHRDVILVDQRGTRFCQPALTSPEWEDAISHGKPLEDAARAAAQRLRAEGIDLDAYHSLAIAQDLRETRRQMGIDRWNLVTTSYSTKVAQALMHIDAAALRTVVLDSPMPLDRRYDEEHNANLAATIEQFLVDCESDPACRAAYPGLRARFTGMMTAATPAQRIAMFAELDLGAPGPDPARAGRAWNALQEGVRETIGKTDSSSSAGFAMGMRLAVWSAEEAAFADQALVASETSAHQILGETSPALFSGEVVAAFDVAAADPILTRPVSSNVPTLILVGTHDPLTPLRWAEHLAVTLDKATLVPFAGWGHSPLYYWDQPLGIELADAFIQHPEQPLPGEALDAASRCEFDTP